MKFIFVYLDWPYMKKNGMVFTKEWVVEMMLDLAGYTPDQDLAKLVTVEPSFGEGAFLLPIVKRLLKSAENYERPISQLYSSIRAYELSPESVQITRGLLEAYMVHSGFSAREVSDCLDHWLFCQDYLLSSQEEDVDLVIGNPPYIRSNDIPSSLKESYLKTCRTMTPGADLFVGFIERGLGSLKEGGTLSYICADRWMHNSYGKKLRKYVAESFSVSDIIVMHDVDVFDRNVSAYPAITTIKNRKQGEVRYAKADTLFSGVDASDYAEWCRNRAHAVGHCECSILKKWFSGDQLWPLAEPSKLSLIKHLEETFPPLEDEATGTKVGIGVATGRDAVFIVSDPAIAESERVVPVITSRQLNRNGVNSDPLWLINPWDENEQLVELDRYPSMKRYFEKNATELKKRQVARKGEPGAWYRTIDKVHPKLAEKPKLLIQDMHARFEPYYDDRHYPHGNLYYVTSEKWNLEVLGGLLMSSICEAFIDAYGVKMRGGTLRFQAQYLRTIRVPMVDSLTGRVKENLREAFLTKNYKQADSAARIAYGLREGK